MFFDAVENTFKILEEKGITREFLYGNAEQKDGFNIPFDKLFEKLGITVKFEENLQDDNGKTISGKSDYENNTIYINKSECSQRKRFTLGHELYHVLNNQNENRDKNTDKDPQEICANAFAAKFLMPKDVLEKKFKEFNQSVWMTADYFKVSWEAMGYRLVNCGLSR